MAARRSLAAFPTRTAVALPLAFLLLLLLLLPAPAALLLAAAASAAARTGDGMAYSRRAQTLGGVCLSVWGCAGFPTARSDRLLGAASFASAPHNDFPGMSSNGDGKEDQGGNVQTPAVQPKGLAPRLPPLEPDSSGAGAAPSEPDSSKFLKMLANLKVLVNDEHAPAEVAPPSPTHGLTEHDQHRHRPDAVHLRLQVCKVLSKCTLDTDYINVVNIVEEVHGTQGLRLVKAGQEALQEAHKSQQRVVSKQDVACKACHSPQPVAHTCPAVATHAHRSPLH